MKSFVFFGIRKTAATPYTKSVRALLNSFFSSQLPLAWIEWIFQVLAYFSGIGIFLGQNKFGSPQFVSIIRRYSNVFMIVMRTRVKITVQYYHILKVNAVTTLVCSNHSGEFCWQIIVSFIQYEPEWKSECKSFSWRHNVSLSNQENIMQHNTNWAIFVEIQGWNIPL